MKLDGQIGLGCGVNVPVEENGNFVSSINSIQCLKLEEKGVRNGGSTEIISASEEDDLDPIGSIVNISSIAARRAHPDLLAYSVSCAALDQMTRSLAVAFAPKRIRVNAVAFGSVMSASLKASLSDDDDARNAIIGNTPLHRIAGPGEVSDAVQYLASDAAGFVTGQIITVDGGRTLIDPAAVSAH